jgi:hypothetical protein
MVKLFVKGLKDNQHLVEAQFEKTFGMPEMNVQAGGGATTITTPLEGAQEATFAPVLVLDGQVVGRVLLPSLRAEEIRLGVQLAR